MASKWGRRFLVVMQLQHSVLAIRLLTVWDPSQSESNSGSKHEDEHEQASMTNSHCPRSMWFIMIVCVTRRFINYDSIATIEQWLIVGRKRLDADDIRLSTMLPSHRMLKTAIYFLHVKRKVTSCCCYGGVTACTTSDTGSLVGSTVLPQPRLRQNPNLLPRPCQNGHRIRAGRGHPGAATLSPGREETVPESGVSSPGWVVQPELDAGWVEVGTCENK